ncbi:MAG: flagellar biosynthetic protein FliR [Sphingomonadaceae bacterium]
MLDSDLARAVAAPEAFLLDLIWCSLRTGGALALLPALGGQGVPVQVRVGLAGAIGLFVMTGADPPRPPDDLISLGGMVAAGGELLIGLAVAVALHAAFAAALVAGEWISQAMGLGFATVVNPGVGPMSVLSAVFLLLAWSLFLAAGGHLLVIEVLVESYRAMPSAGTLLEPERLSVIIAWGGFAMASGLIAALPLGGAMLLLNIVIAMAAKSSPQLNLFAVGFPLMLLVGIAGLPLALPGMAASLGNTLLDLQGAIRNLILG